MPLYIEAEQRIRENLRRIRKGRNPRIVTIGFLTDRQLRDINSERASRKMPPIVADVVFGGKHIYESRVLRDGYTVEDVLEQIKSSMSEVSEV